MAGLLQAAELFGEDIPALAGLREKGRSFFALPAPKNEAWKYTGLQSLNCDDFAVLPSKFLQEAEEEHHCHCGEHDCESEEHCCCGDEHCRCHHPQPPVTALPFDAYPLYFCNGQFIPIYPAVPQGVEIMTLMEAVVNGEVKNYLNKNIDLAQYPFAALNTAYLEEGLFIKIGRNVRLNRPILLINRNSGKQQNLLCNLRNLIVCESGSEAALLEWFDGDSPRYFNNSVNEIYLQAGARLNHYKLQNESPEAVHIALNRVLLREGAVYNGFCLQKGGKTARNETKLDLLQENAKAEVNAAYVAAGSAVTDTTTDIEHIAPHTYSAQVVKGVIKDKARGVFQGRIHILPDAQATEGSQLHRAMLLSDDAEVDVKPELRIYADDVKCSHGAACGRLDEEQLFYLRSRGIDEDAAKKMLIEAYLFEAINRIEESNIREWFMQKAMESRCDK